jgi:hypothetical protein
MGLCFWWCDNGKGSGVRGQIADNDVEEGFGEEWRVVEAFGAEEAEAESARGFGEGDVDIVEDFDVVR